MIKYTPYEYQEYATSRILDTPCIGLFLDMGLGKTVSTLTALNLLINDLSKSDKILVIAPFRVAENTWSSEIDKWGHVNHLTISKILGNVSQRKRALQTNADIYIINRENVVWLVDELGNNWDFDTVVIDELSSFKSAQSKRFKALRSVRPFMKRVIGLTGTPAPNSLIDLWSQIYLLDQGQRLGKTITEYRNKYFKPGIRRGRIVYNWESKTGTQEKIYEAISDIVVSMKAEDWLAMPKRINNHVKLYLDEATDNKYKQLEKDLLLPLIDSDIVASSATVLSNKLLQMANGAVYDENKEVQKIHDVKIDALDEIIDTANGQPVLVFYTYKHDLSRIQEKFEKAVKLEDGEDVKNWNKGKIPILLAHPDTAGYGLNLQEGGHIIVWFGLTWSLELYQQANARLYRQGQNSRSVIIHHLITSGTIDEDIVRTLENKETKQDALLEAVKARIENVKKNV